MDFTIGILSLNQVKRQEICLKRQNKSDALKEDIHDLDVLVYAEAVQAGSNSADSAWATMD